MALHLTFRGDASLVSRYLPFAKKELRALKKRRERRGVFQMAKTVKGTDGVLGRIELVASRSEDWIHISVRGGPLLIYAEITKTESVSGVDSTIGPVQIADARTRIKGHLHSINRNITKAKHKEILQGGLNDADIEHGDNYEAPVSYGQYIIARHQHYPVFWGPPPGVTPPGDIESGFEGPYEPSFKHWKFDYQGNEQAAFDEVAGRPSGDETMWSDFFRYYPASDASGNSSNHLSSDGKTVTSYVAVSDTYYYEKGRTGEDSIIKGDYHTITPYIVRRDLSTSVLPSEIKQTLTAFSQNFSGAKEYYSPNHVLDTLFYDIVGGLNGFRGHSGIIAIDQDAIHMTTHKRTRASGVDATDDLFIEVSWISIDIETGAETVHDTWSFNHNIVFKGGAKTMFAALRTQPVGNSNVVGWVEGNFGADDLKFYAGPKADGMGGAAHKFTISSLHEIFRQSGETLEGHFREAFSVLFWSVNNASSWEDENGSFQDNQVYGTVVTGRDSSLTGSDDPDVIRIYRSEGGATPVLVKEYQQHLGNQSNGYDIKAQGEWILLYLPGRDAGATNKIDRIWKIFNIETEEEKDIPTGLVKTFDSVSVIPEFDFLVRPPRRFR